MTIIKKQKVVHVLMKDDEVFQVFNRLKNAERKLQKLRGDDNQANCDFQLVEDVPFLGVKRKAYKVWVVSCATCTGVSVECVCDSLGTAHDFMAGSPTDWFEGRSVDRVPFSVNV